MRSVLWTVAITLIGGVAFAQGESEPPKAGPEHKELGYFVGDWTTEGEAKATPFSPAYKWSGTFTYEWLPGEFFLIRKLDENYSDSGSLKSVFIVGYEPEAKVYTWDGFNSRGGRFETKGSVVDDTFTFVWEQEVEGKTIKNRGTLKLLPPDAADWKVEYSEDGKTWTAFAHAKDARVK